MSGRSDREVEALLMANRHLVYSVARRHFPGRQGDPDLLQAGTIGLWRAAGHWDGCRPFPVYARACIQNAMTDCLRREKPLQQPIPVIQDAQAQGMERELADRALYRRIRAAWPAGSRQRQVLLALAGPWTKPQLAQAMGLSTRQLTRLARRAWQQVPPET